MSFRDPVTLFGGTPHAGHGEPGLMCSAMRLSSGAPDVKKSAWSPGGFFSQGKKRPMDPTRVKGEKQRPDEALLKIRAPFRAVKDADHTATGEDYC